MNPKRDRSRWGALPQTMPTGPWVWLSGPRSKSPSQARGELGLDIPHPPVPGLVGLVGLSRPGGPVPVPGLVGLFLSPPGGLSLSPARRAGSGPLGYSSPAWGVVAPWSCLRRGATLPHRPVCQPLHAQAARPLWPLHGALAPSSPALLRDTLPTAQSPSLGAQPPSASLCLRSPFCGQPRSAPVSPSSSDPITVSLSLPEPLPSPTWVTRSHISVGIPFQSLTPPRPAPSSSMDLPVAPDRCAQGGQEGRRDRLRGS